MLYRVALIIADKKQRSLEIDKIKQAARAQAIDLIVDDPSRWFPAAAAARDGSPGRGSGSPNGVDAIVHKISKHIASADAGDPTSRRILDAFESYTARLSDVLVLDPIEKVRRVLDRDRLCAVLKTCEFGRPDDSSGSSSLLSSAVRCPPYVTIRDVAGAHAAIEAAGISYPLIAKPLIANGSRQSHQIALVFNHDGLDTIPVPYTVQQYINHGAVLFKVFVVGEKWAVVKRPSIRNLSADGDLPTIVFDSADVSKTHSTSQLNEAGAVENYEAMPPTEVVEEMVRRLQQSLSVSLFGVDVVIEEGTGTLFMIDVNYFPGYKYNVPGAEPFPEMFAKFLRARLDGSR